MGIFFMFEAMVDRVGTQYCNKMISELPSEYTTRGIFTLMVYIVGIYLGTEIDPQLESQKLLRTRIQSLG